MSNEKLLTEIELLKQADINHEKTHKAIMEQFSEFNKENKKEHNEMFKAVGDIKSSIDLLPEKLDKRYASKETENIVKRTGWLIISAVIIALLALVIK
jgi:NAD+--asparagine ADP-ribosyltransferase